MLLRRPCSSRGLINLKIEPEVSQIDTTHSVTVANGISVPALIVRRASTTVELRDGQSFVIGGLLQSNNQNQIEQLPWLGSVPVLGALFSSKSYQKNETDLAIIVTPHLVRPARPGDVVKTPADDTLPPNDPDFFLLGKTEMTRDAGARTHARHGSRRRRRRPTVHRPHARSAEGNIQCGHPITSLRTLALAALLAALAGCSEYLDRRDTISLQRRQRGRDQQGHPDGRSVAARQRQPQHRLQRRRRWKAPSSAIAPTR